MKVTNARYDLENAKLNLEKMNVKAPFDGVIVNLPHYTTDVRVEQGKPMVGVMDYARMYMDVNLPESAISYVKANQPVYITHYTLPEDTLKAVISELSPAISTETRTFKGKVLIMNNDLKLRPGMFVKADIVVDRPTAPLSSRKMWYSPTAAANMYSSWIRIRQSCGISRQGWKTRTISKCWKD